MTTISRSTSNINTPYSEKRLLAAKKAIQALSPLAYKIEKKDLEAACETAERILQEKVSLTGTEYLKKESTKSPTDLLINHTDKSYTILKTGALACEGTEKKVTSAIKIFFLKKDESEKKENEETEAQAKAMSRIVNKSGILLSDRELHYEELYGQIEDLTSYKSQKGETKTSYLKAAYDHDVFMYAIPGLLKSQGIKAPPACELLSIVLPVAKTVEKMHADGVVHRDIKGLNILVKHTPQETDTATLTDFGLAYAPGKEPVTARQGCYGTPAYTAPDRMPAAANPEKADSALERAKADDMYALGCVLFELLFEQELPWADDMIDHWEKNDPQLGKNAFQRQTSEAMELSSLVNIQTDPSAKTVVKCLAGLLEPDPTKRMTIEEFVKELSSIKVASCDFMVQEGVSSPLLLQKKA